MSDREAFTEARTAGLKQRHEQRLSHAQAVIPDEALEAMCDLTYAGKQLSLNHARLLLEAALPHLRAHQIEVQTRIGYELGRKEAQAEIAVMLEERAAPRSGSDVARYLVGLAATIRDIGKGDPK